jgi:hypothetical protein
MVNIKHKSLAKNGGSSSSLQRESGNDREILMTVESSVRKYNSIDVKWKFGGSAVSFIRHHQML